MTVDATKTSSKDKLVLAALDVFRAQGYAGTTVEDVCKAAGVTKGSFFHHFQSKEELTLAAVKYFSGMAERLFSQAPFHSFEDPLDRLLGYVEFRIAILSGELNEYTCLLGTLTQETYHTHPTIREACLEGFTVHISELRSDV